MTAADGCRSVAELPKARSVSSDSAFAGGCVQMTVRKHTQHKSLRKNPLHHFRTGVSTLRAHRLNVNIDSIIIQIYIVAKAKGLNQITLPTWHFLNCYETCRVMSGLETRRTAQQLNWLTFSGRVGLTRMRSCRVSLAWICVGSCVSERANSARSQKIARYKRHNAYTLRSFLLLWNDWAEIPFLQNCTFHLFLELPVCLLPMEHVVPVLRYSNWCSVHIARHIEWSYRMPSTIIFRFRISSVLVWCTVTLHAVHHHILLFLSWLSSCALIVILCVTVRHTKYFNCCIGYAVFRSLLMYSPFVWSATNSVVFLSSDYVL